MENNQHSILIGEDNSPYQVPLNLIQIATYTDYLFLESDRELNSICKLLGLDLYARNKHGNTINFSSDEKIRRKLRNINKGLVFELFVGFFMRYIDKPIHVKCHCKSVEVTNDNQTAMPVTFAKGGLPDIEIDYDEFKLILEVSAKKDMNIESYKKQTDSAAEQARGFIEQGYDKPIYLLMINQSKLSDSKVREVFDNAVKSVSEHNIKLLHISIDEFSELGQELGRKYNDQVTKMTGEDFQELLDAFYESILTPSNKIVLKDLFFNYFSGKGFSAQIDMNF